MVGETTTEIAHTKGVAQNKLVQNVWRANVNPKLTESVPEEPVRMGLQAIAWVLMLVFLLVVFIYSYLHQRCETFTSLLSAQDAIDDNHGYTCEPIEVPQVFDGQPYYDTAYWWGFGVLSAWGTFRGSDWTEYCGGLMAQMKEVTNFVVDSDVPDWTYEFKNTTGGIDECNYTTDYYTDLDTLPNAPGGLLGCSYPEAFGNCTADGNEGGESIDGSEIYGAISITSNSDANGPFCADFIVWNPFTVMFSPLDNENVDDFIPDLCTVWGQDVGIVSKAVQSCEKEVCKKWYWILSDAIALAFAIEVAVVVIIILFFKVRENYEEKQRQEQSSRDGSGGEEKGGDEEKEPEDVEGKITFAQDAGKAVFAAGQAIKTALA
ncbi:unnamed protein product [Ectocarpus sp. 12 AP-2014]